MPGPHLLEDRKLAASRLIELTSELCTRLAQSTSRLPKKMSLEAQRLSRIEDRRTLLRKLDMMRDFTGLLGKLLPGIADELGLERTPIQDCLEQIEISIGIMSRS
jgi:hypothetical protein